MYFHVYLIYRFTRTFTDHSSVITRCWGFELQNGKSSLKSPQTLATQDFAPASFLSTPDSSSQASYRLRRAFYKSSSFAHSAAPRFSSGKRFAGLPDEEMGCGAKISEWKPPDNKKRTSVLQVVLLFIGASSICCANRPPAAGFIEKQGETGAAPPAAKEASLF